MASVHHYTLANGEHRWRVRYRKAGGGNPNISGFTSARKAQDVADEIERYERDGIPWVRSSRTRTSFEAVALAWVDDAIIEDISPPRIAARALNHAQFGAWLHGRRKGTLWWDRVDRKAIRDWYRALQDGYMAQPVEARKAEDHWLQLEPSTAYEKAMSIFSLWRWARDSDEFRGAIAEVPLRIRIPKPAPSLRPFAPTFAQMDAAVLATPEDHWTRRLALCLRYTHKRKQQIMNLRWEDVDLRQLTLEVRPGLPGSKAHEKKFGSFQPLHPALAEEMAGWGRREGWLIDRTVGHASKRPCVPDRRSVPHPKLRAMWAGAHEAGALTDAELRDLRQPAHCFRKGLFTSLLVLGASSDLLDYLQGRSLGSTGLNSYTAWRRMEPALRSIMDLTPAVADVPMQMPRVVEG